LGGSWLGSRLLGVFRLFGILASFFLRLPRSKLLGLSMKPGLSLDLDLDIVQLPVERLFELWLDLIEAVFKLVKSLPLQQDALVILLKTVREM